MDRRQLMIGTGAFALAAGGGLMSGGTVTGLSPLGAAFAQESEAEAEAPKIVEMALGDENAPVTVVEYASFTCPHCANFHKDQAQKLKADYIDSGKVRFIYRDVYFDRPGLWAAMIARCDPQRFFGISDILYRQQRDWIGDGSPVQIADNLRKIGRVAGIPDDRLEACLTDAAKAQALVQWSQKLSDEAEVEGTPTLVINDVKYANMAWDELKEIIDTELAK